MKKIRLFFTACLTMLFVLQVFNLQSQNDITSEFPDPIFKAYVCEKLGITEPPILDNNPNFATLKIINVAGRNIGSLNGLQFFTGLEELNCNDNNLGGLPNLPLTLTHLECNHNIIEGLPYLPTGLTYLDCSFNKLPALPTFSPVLETLICSHNLLPALPGFAGTLEYLDCSYNQLLGLPTLTDLVYLDCSHNQLPGLPTLVLSLTYLDCSYNEIPGLPWMNELSKLAVFKCSNNQITALPNLPGYNASFPGVLKELDCSNNLLGSLTGGILLVGFEMPAGTWNQRSLPNELEILNLSGNDLISLNLPDLGMNPLTNLVLLDCRWNYMLSPDLIVGITTEELLFSPQKLFALTEYDKIGDEEWCTIARDEKHEIEGTSKFFTQCQLNAFWSAPDAPANTAAMVSYLKVDKVLGVDYDYFEVVLGNGHKPLTFAPEDLGAYSEWGCVDDGYSYYKWPIAFADRDGAGVWTSRFASGGLSVTYNFYKGGVIIEQIPGQQLPTITVGEPVQSTVTIKKPGGETITNGETFDMCLNYELSVEFGGAAPYELEYKVSVDGGAPQLPSTIGLPDLITDDTSIPAGALGSYQFTFVSFTDGNECAGTGINTFSVNVLPHATMELVGTLPEDIACEGEYSFGVKTNANCDAGAKVLAQILLSDPDVRDYITILYYQDEFATTPLTLTFDSYGYAIFDTYAPADGFELGDRTATFVISNTGNAPADTEFDVEVTLYIVATEATLDVITLEGMKVLRCLDLTAEDITVTAGLPATSITVITGTSGADSPGLTAVVEIDGDPMLSNVSHPILGTIAFTFDGTTTTATIPNFTYTQYDLVLGTLKAAHVGKYDYVVKIYNGSALVATSNTATLKVNVPELGLHAEDIVVLANKVYENVEIINGLTQGVYYDNLFATIEIYGGNPNVTATHTVLGTIDFTPGSPTFASLYDFTYTDIPLVLNTLMATEPGNYTYKILLHNLELRGLVKESNEAEFTVIALPMKANNINVYAGIEAHNILVISDTEGDDKPGLTATIEIKGNPGITNVYHAVLGNIVFTYNSGANTTTATISNFTYTQYELVMDNILALNAGTYNYTITLFEGNKKLNSSSAVLNVNPLPLKAENIEVLAREEAVNVTVVTGTGIAEGDIAGLRAEIVVEGKPELVNVYHDVLGDIIFTYDEGTNKTSATINPFTYTAFNLVINKLTAMNVGEYPYTITLYNDYFLASASAILNVKVPPCPSSVMDEVNNIEYTVVAIAGRCWFKENLRSRLYQDESEIPFAAPYNHPQYPDVNQNEINFGLLYTYDAIFPENGQTVCPEYWLIPTSEEWALLNMYSAEDLKNDTYWLQPNNNTNLTGFDARGAGLFNDAKQQFEDLYGYTAFWSSNDTSGTITTVACFNYYCTHIEYKSLTKANAISVRCIRDL